MRLSSAIAATILATGCGDSSSEAVDAPVDAKPAITFSAKWGPLMVPPGQEDTRCITVRAGNMEAAKVHSIKNTLTGGSHHLIVYRDNAATAENLTPTPCQPFAGTLKASSMGATPIMITQKAEESLTLPDGVAYTFSNNQFLRLEMHYINSGDAPLEISAVSEFTTLDPSEVKHEADFLFLGTPDIDLMPGETETVERFLTMRTNFQGINIFAITGHTHHFGTDVQVGHAASAGGAATSVYKPMTFKWDEPETTFHNPPFQVPNGGGFSFKCDFRNTSNQRVRFGESANEEMCFFWAYYYPSRGAHVCINTHQVGGAPGVDVCCPDDGSICDRLIP